ncbi:MAG: hypothetical protein LBF28_00525 [Rickettsiales bacterium]|jgi:hypothetical protein|nr:hypothetical protein [Rickettsiales bacterium]
MKHAGLFLLIFYLLICDRTACASETICTGDYKIVKKECVKKDECDKGIDGYTIFEGLCITTENKNKIERQRKETSQKEVDKLKANAQTMRDKENSTANKMLGGAAIGATGIGAGQLLQGKAEQSADEASERDMKAYLATFVCDYGQGRNIKGGEMEIVLPGGNDMIDLYTEYKTLAASLKITKEALGLKLGIESEAILDKADAGLYDNVAIEKTGGPFASLSRALQNPGGKDAAAWDKQKSESADRAKTGGTVAAVGVIGGVVGNLAVNEVLPNLGKGTVGNALSSVVSGKTTDSTGSILGGGGTLAVNGISGTESFSAITRYEDAESGAKQAKKAVDETLRKFAAKINSKLTPDNDMDKAIEKLDAIPNASAREVPPKLRELDIVYESLSDALSEANSAKSTLDNAQRKVREEKEEDDVKTAKDELDTAQKFAAEAQENVMKIAQEIQSISASAIEKMNEVIKYMDEQNDMKKQEAEDIRMAEEAAAKKTKDAEDKKTAELESNKQKVGAINEVSIKIPGYEDAGRDADLAKKEAERISGTFAAKIGASDAAIENITRTIEDLSDENQKTLSIEIPVILRELNIKYIALSGALEKAAEAQGALTSANQAIDKIKKDGGTDAATKSAIDALNKAKRSATETQTDVVNMVQDIKRLSSNAVEKMNTAIEYKDKQIDDVNKKAMEARLETEQETNENTSRKADESNELTESTATDNEENELYDNNEDNNEDAADGDIE